uniref:RING-type domain-containing protein n=2 Tax=Oryzias melastigma TaxID=30732 RepID=A0A3B3CUE0_ORYME
MACSSELLDCSICLQLLEEPVTTACGHSFCRGCIETFWKSKADGWSSCPQCRRTFSSRPVLHKNIVLMGLVEDYKRRSAAADEDDDDYAAPGDIQCDICRGRKKKADMYCLVCLAFYCQTHLQPHFDVAPLKKHSLVQASTKVMENICRRHDRRLEMFCRTDQQLLCPLCVLAHSAHEVVEIKEEMMAKQRLMRRKRQETENRVKESEGEMMELKKAADSIRDAAWEACDDFEQQCAEHIRWYTQYLDGKCMEMRETVGQLEKAGLDWTWSRRGQLERDVNRLKGVQHKLSQLSQTDDPIQFFQGFQALTDLLAFKGSEERPNSLEEFVSACKEKLKHTCTREKDLLFHQPGQKECKCDGFWSSRRRPVSKDVFLCCSFKDSWEAAPKSLKKRDLCLVQVC